MEAAFIRNMKNGQLIANIPLQFIQLPNINESIQLGNTVFTVTNVIHAWRTPNEPLCEIRVMPAIREEALVFESSTNRLEASAELSIGVMKIRFSPSEDRLLCEVFIIDIKVAEYYLERNGSRIFGKAPAGVGDAEFELWWEGENIHGKVRVCKSIMGAVMCTDWAEGSVRVG